MENTNGSEAGTKFQVNRRTVLPPRRPETTTSGSTVSADNKLRQIGQNLFVSSKEIGKSGTGTVVYEGIYYDKPIAVKRIQQSHDAEREINMFVAVSKQSENVVRYYGEEYDRDFAYIVLERCNCNLDDLIQIYSTDSSQNKLESKEYLELKSTLGDVKLWEENNGRPSHLLLKLMRDMVSGLVVLHESRIVHRDLKPQNILVVKENSTLCAKLADMGGSRKLRDNKSSFTNISRCGTMGWKAKECLLAQETSNERPADPHKKDDGERLTRAMDMFGLGCLLFYCITRGIHPFGGHDERNMNIRNDNVKNMAMIEKFPEAFHLISLLLKADPMNRPKAEDLLHHPLFWDAKKRFSFLSDIGEIVSNDSNISNVLKSTANTIFGTETKYLRRNVVRRWKKKVHAGIISHIRKNAKPDYNFSSVGDLLRLIGYILKHYKQLPDDIKKHIGSQHEGLNDYFTSRFPLLFIEVYKVVYAHLGKEENFKKYFEEI